LQRRNSSDRRVRDGSILGIELDLGLYEGSLDRFERWLRGDLLAKTLGADVSTSSVDLRFHDLGGKCAVEIETRRHPQPAWLTFGQVKEALFVRNGNETRQLEGRQMVESGQNYRRDGP